VWGRLYCYLFALQDRRIAGSRPNMEGREKVAQLSSSFRLANCIFVSACRLVVAFEPCQPDSISSVR
jgi:hypothetical protein